MDKTSEKKTRVITAILEVEREPGSKLFRIAPWDCLRDAFSSIIGYYEIAREQGQISSSKTVPRRTSTRLRPSLTRATSKWPIKVLDHNTLKSVYGRIRSLPRVTGREFRGGDEHHWNISRTKEICDCELLDNNTAGTANNKSIINLGPGSVVG